MSTGFLRSKHMKRWLVELAVFVAVSAAVYFLFGEPWQLCVSAAYIAYAIGASIGYGRGLRDHAAIVIEVQRDVAKMRSERTKAAPWN